MSRIQKCDIQLKCKNMIKRLQYPRQSEKANDFLHKKLSIFPLQNLIAHLIAAKILFISCNGFAIKKLVCPFCMVDDN